MINKAKEYRKLSRLLQSAYVKEIARQDLIDTGLMINTFTVTAVNLKRYPKFDISTVDYFVYVDGNFKVTDNVLRGSLYRKFEQALEDLQLQILIEKI
tara:strand:- start:174 stop:467 length:294 start_codon:yes stop_codon:yes gene_type:complete